MSGAQALSAAPETRRRRVRFRSWHRGMREMDLILGRFADAEIETLTEAELDAFEAVMEEQDHDVFSWLTGAQPLPAEFDTLLFQKIEAFHAARVKSDD